MIATTATAPKNQFELMARHLQDNLKSGLIIPSEAMLAQLLHEMMDKFMSKEFQELVNEFTNLAAKEKDSGRRAGYFKAAKLVQSRMPAKPKMAPLPE